MKVEFPGLGLSFEISTVAFRVFGVPIYWYGIIIAFAFLLAILLALRSCRKYDIEQDTILDLVLYAAPAAIVGARLYYVIFNWEYFKGDIKAILDIRSGGLAIYGSVIAAVIVALIYCRAKKINFFKLTDFAIPYLLLGQGIGRWGNFVNQEAFGDRTTLPWRMNGDVINSFLLKNYEGIDLSKEGVHPTFLYESLWDIAVFLFLIWYRKKKKVDGEVLSLYFIMYGVGRFLIEGLRTDSLMLGEFRVSRLLSLILAVAFAGVFVYLRVRKENIAEEAVEEEVRSEYRDLLEKIRQEEEEEMNASSEEGQGGTETHTETQSEAETQDDAKMQGDAETQSDVQEAASDASHEADNEIINPAEGDEKQEEAVEQK